MCSSPIFKFLNRNFRFKNFHFKRKPVVLDVRRNFAFQNLSSQGLNLDTKTTEIHDPIKKKEKFSIEDISNLKPDLFNKCDITKWLKFLDEISDAQTKGKLLPSYLNVEAVEELLELESPRQRMKYWTFLFKKERTKARKKLKKILESKNGIEEYDNIQYGLKRNTLILGFRRQTYNKFYRKRLANSVLFGQKIVFDLSYDQFMWKKERRDCVAQLRLVYSLNRQNCNPYDLYFCNASPNSFCVQYIHEEMPTMDNSMISLTEESYLDIFPREQLVYLSPHASENLTKYDHNAIYIIGGLVDTSPKGHLSLYKSRDEKIQSYALPLDEHIKWGAGSRSLTINQVFSILMTLRDTANWKEAMKHVPDRKIKKIQD